MDGTRGYHAGGLTLVLATPISTGQTPTPDPLASLAPPDTTGLPVQSAAPLIINSLFPTVLQPGIYRGGINIQGLSIVTMQSGVYVMDGGGFQVSTGGVVLGGGVLIYNTAGASAGPISLTGLGAVVLTPPTSGPYTGIGFWQDRGLTNPIQISGLGVAQVSGAIYAPSAPVTLTASAAVVGNVLGGAHIAASLRITGIGSIGVNLGTTNLKAPDVRLVE